MIVHLYRWRLRPGREEAFTEAWAEVTTAYRAAGSSGSALFRTTDGLWCAIARWPDQQTREQASSLRGLGAARAVMDGAIAQRIEILDLTEVLNLWAPYPPEAPGSGFG